MSEPKPTPATYVGKIAGIDVWTHPAVRRHDVIFIQGSTIQTMTTQTKGQLIREHRLRKRLTELQCAKHAGCPHAVWLGLEQDQVTPEPELRAFVDKFTDGAVPVGAW